MLQVKKTFLLSALITTGLLSGCTSLERYNQLDQSYAQLQKAYQADEVEIARLQGMLKVSILDKVLFKTGGFRLDNQAKAVLDKMVPTLSRLKETKILVRGYTDSQAVGSGLRSQEIKDNLDLSERRAESVTGYLIEKGVNPAMIATQGLGEKDPVISNETPDGRAQNRRVEVVLLGSGN